MTVILRDAIEGRRVEPLFVDDCTRPAIEVWKDVDAESPDRIKLCETGGPGGRPYRKLTVEKGDNPGGWGERCEVGANSLKEAAFLYQEGERWVTTMWRRLPRDYPIDSRLFQSVMQMKQTGWSALSPVLSLNAQRDGWEVLHTTPSGETTRVWNTPARRGRWERITFDVLYSAERGRVVMEFRGQRVLDLVTNTLLGAPSHLRAGIYHHNSLPPTTVHVGPTAAGRVV